MKKIIAVILLIGFSGLAGADTILVFGFDNNDEPNGIQYLGSDQLIDFSGVTSAVAQTSWNVLDTCDGTANFSIGAVGDISSFSGTLTSGGGKFEIGASGGGIDAVGSDSTYFDSSSEFWTFTFSEDIVLTAVHFYSPNTGDQIILTNGAAVFGSPFDTDFSGDIFVSAGDTLIFGYADPGTGGSYGIDDFTITVVPEPAVLSILGLGGLLILFLRRFYHR